MAGDSITLALDGSPSLGDLTKALDGLRSLVEALGTQVGATAPLQWLVERLDASSAIATFAGTSEDQRAVGRVVDAYLDVGRALVTGELPPGLDFRGARAAEEIVGVINGRVTSVRFETADDDVLITSSRGLLGVATETLAAIQGYRDAIPGAYGAVRGRVQTLSSRSGLRFTLYDLLHNKAVSCYLREGEESIMRDAWDRVALVKGWVKRDPRDGRPLSIRNVTDVELLDEGVRGSWRSAAGALRGTSGSEPAESIIRRLRDA